MPNDSTIDGLHIKLRVLTWGSVVTVLVAVAMASMWYQRVESELNQRTEDRYRARDARADLAVRDARLDAHERWIKGLDDGMRSDLREIKLELAEIRKMLFERQERKI